ncbi:MAG: hypothetical protein A2270_07350 [Elusimicrobia bacterium RIFOXYA12_FULL_51_18]|nr:MAG: hypothetical protein A2270_07350 [Elusimicrobia bacterium RIFOXYA12_FULL_51_18]OGS28498.1 MAG: hypothetical protein A2218_05655 [Elusimicrobia bacterium RIFOXYA2_FULL_53_38]
MKIEEIQDLLVCPDDGQGLSSAIDGSLSCVSCGKNFKYIDKSFLEILPLKFSDWDADSARMREIEGAYRNMFQSSFSWGVPSHMWGELDKASMGYQCFVRAERRKILNMLKPAKDSIAVDVSACAGNYSCFLAEYVKVMFHCDLHSPSLVYAYRHKRDNMFFLRSPYHNIPLKNAAFDYVFCTDTIIRGFSHDLKLLSEIYRLLKKGGKAVVDFHNKNWITSSESVRFYSPADIEVLMRMAGIDNYSVTPFGYVPLKTIIHKASYEILDNICGFFLPCQRNLVVIIKE